MRSDVLLRFFYAPIINLGCDPPENLQLRLVSELGILSPEFRLTVLIPIATRSVRERSRIGAIRVRNLCCYVLAGRRGAFVFEKLVWRV